MQVLIINHRQVTELLPMADCIDVMAALFRALGQGEAVLPLRQAVWQPDRRGAVGVMPAYLDDPAALGAKIVSVFPGNAATRYESHQGAVLLFATRHGQLLAMVDAGAVTAIRTAAVSALATRLLAPERAGDLAILGAGTQADMHLAAMQAIRPVRRVRVWSRDAGHARRFAEAAARRYGVPVSCATTAREAVADAEIICTVTGATEPILEGDWLAPGAHINAVGASVPPFRELDTAAVARSRLFVDRNESALAEADDIRVPLQHGAISEDHIQGELADLVLEHVSGRTATEEITLFKSVGLAAEDLAAAHYVYAQALETDAGIGVDFGAERDL